MQATSQELQVPDMLKPDADADTQVLGAKQKNVLIVSDILQVQVEELPSSQKSRDREQGDNIPGGDKNKENKNIELVTEIDYQKEDTLKNNEELSGSDIHTNNFSQIDKDLPEEPVADVSISQKSPHDSNAASIDNIVEESSKEPDHEQDKLEKVIENVTASDSESNISSGLADLAVSMQHSVKDINQISDDKQNIEQSETNLPISNDSTSTDYFGGSISALLELQKEVTRIDSMVDNNSSHRTSEDRDIDANKDASASKKDVVKSDEIEASEVNTKRITQENDNFASEGGKGHTPVDSKEDAEKLNATEASEDNTIREIKENKDYVSNDDTLKSLNHTKKFGEDTEEATESCGDSLKSSLDGSRKLSIDDNILNEHVSASVDDNPDKSEERDQQIVNIKEEHDDDDKEEHDDDDKDSKLLLAHFKNSPGSSKKRRRDKPNEMAAKKSSFVTKKLVVRIEKMNLEKSQLIVKEKTIANDDTLKSLDHMKDFGEDTEEVAESFGSSLQPSLDDNGKLFTDGNKHVSASVDDNPSKSKEDQLLVNIKEEPDDDDEDSKSLLTLFKKSPGSSKKHRRDRPNEMVVKRSLFVTKKLVVRIAKMNLEKPKLVAKEKPTEMTALTSLSSTAMNDEIPSARSSAPVEQKQLKNDGVGQSKTLENISFIKDIDSNKDVRDGGSKFEATVSELMKTSILRTTKDSTDKRQKSKRVISKKQAKGNLCKVAPTTSSKLPGLFQPIKRTFFCEICSLSFNCVRRYWNHKNLLHQNHKFDCIFCDKQFIKTAALLHHNKYKHEECIEESLEMDKPLFYCEACGKGFRNIQKRVNHVLEEHKDGCIFCSLCDYACFDIDNFIFHSKEHTQFRKTLFSCKECGQNVFFLHMFINHMYGHENVTSPRKFYCKICSCKVEGFKKFVFHMERHVFTNPKYYCFICEKKFFSNKKLQLHTKYYHQFNYLEHQKFLQLRDTNLSAGKDCYWCGKMVPNRIFKSHLKYHRKYFTFTTKTLLITCKVCLKEVAKKCFRKHMSIHKNEAKKRKIIVIKSKKMDDKKVILKGLCINLTKIGDPGKTELKSKLPNNEEISDSTDKSNNSETLKINEITGDKTEKSAEAKCTGIKSVHILKRPTSSSQKLKSVKFSAFLNKNRHALKPEYNLESKSLRHKLPNYRIPKKSNVQTAVAETTSSLNETTDLLKGSDRTSTDTISLEARSDFSSKTENLAVRLEVNKITGDKTEKDGKEKCSEIKSVRKLKKPALPIQRLKSVKSSAFLNKNQHVLKPEYNLESKSLSYKLSNYRIPKKSNIQPAVAETTISLNEKTDLLKGTDRSSTDTISLKDTGNRTDQISVDKQNIELTSSQADSLASLQFKGDLLKNTNSTSSETSLKESQGDLTSKIENLQNIETVVTIRSAKKEEALKGKKDNFNDQNSGPIVKNDPQTKSHFPPIQPSSNRNNPIKQTSLKETTGDLTSKTDNLAVSVQHSAKDRSDRTDQISVKEQNIEITNSQVDSLESLQSKTDLLENTNSTSTDTTSLKESQGDLTSKMDSLQKIDIILTTESDKKEETFKDKKEETFKDKKDDFKVENSDSIVKNDSQTKSQFPPIQPSVNFTSALNRSNPIRQYGSLVVPGPSGVDFNQGVFGGPFPPNNPPFFNPMTRTMMNQPGIGMDPFFNRPAFLSQQQQRHAIGGNFANQVMPYMSRPPVYNEQSMSVFSHYSASYMAQWQGQPIMPQGNVIPSTFATSNTYIEPVNQCSGCQQTFSNAKLVEVHEMFCGKLVDKFSTVDEHICPVCSQKFNNLAVTKQHMFVSHSQIFRDFGLIIGHNATKNVCKICDQEFSSKENLKTHEKTHELLHSFKSNLAKVQECTVEKPQSYVVTGSKASATTTSTSRAFLKSEANLSRGSKGKNIGNIKTPQKSDGNKKADYISQSVIQKRLDESLNETQAEGNIELDEQDKLLENMKLQRKKEIKLNLLYFKKQKLEQEKQSRSLEILKTEQEVQQRAGDLTDFKETKGLFSRNRRSRSQSPAKISQHHDLSKNLSRCRSSSRDRPGRQISPSRERRRSRSKEADSSRPTNMTMQRRRSYSKERESLRTIDPVRERRHSRSKERNLKATGRNSRSRSRSRNRRSSPIPGTSRRVQGTTPISRHTQVRDELRDRSRPLEKKTTQFFKSRAGPSGKRSQQDSPKDPSRRKSISKDSRGGQISSTMERRRLHSKERDSSRTTSITTPRRCSPSKERDSSRTTSMTTQRRRSRSKEPESSRTTSMTTQRRRSHSREIDSLRTVNPVRELGYSRSKERNLKPTGRNSRSRSRSRNRRRSSPIPGTSRDVQGSSPKPRRTRSPSNSSPRLLSRTHGKLRDRSRSLEKKTTPLLMFRAGPEPGAYRCSKCATLFTNYRDFIVHNDTHGNSDEDEENYLTLLEPPPPVITGELKSSSNRTYDRFQKPDANYEDMASSTHYGFKDISDLYFSEQKAKANSSSVATGPSFLQRLRTNSQFTQQTHNTAAQNYSTSSEASIPAENDMSSVQKMLTAYAHLKSKASYTPARVKCRICSQELPSQEYLKFHTCPGPF